MSGGNSTGIVNQSLLAAIGATYQTDGCEKKKKTNKTWSDTAVYQPFEVLMICFAGSENSRKEIEKMMNDSLLINLRALKFSDYV